MQRHNKLTARLLSLVMSIAMVSTMMSATVFADEGDAPLGRSGVGVSSIGTIQSFNKLEDRFEPSTGEGAADHIYGLAVELNTPVEDLQLPDALTAMVARSTTTEQETIAVTWNSDKEYVSDANGKFIYTAVLPEGYILVDGVKLPQIYVMVGRQAREGDQHDAINVGIDLTNQATDIRCSHAGDTPCWSYIKSENKLILNGIRMSYLGTCLKLPKDITVELATGTENLVQSQQHISIAAKGITFTGKGKLTVNSTGQACIDTTYGSRIIINDGTLVFNDSNDGAEVSAILGVGAYLDINGGNVTATSPSPGRFAILMAQVNINGGTVSVTATGEGGKPMMSAPVLGSGAVRTSTADWDNTENKAVTYGPAPHKPVTNITGVPTTATAGTDLALTGTVEPSDATNKTIVWSVKDAGVTGATIVGGKLKTTAAGTVTVKATITKGASENSDYTQAFAITVNYKPVTNITGVPTTATAGTDLTLAGTVAPADATSKTIVWSIKDAGTTGANIVGGKLKTTAAGTVVVTATITNGLAVNSAYTKDFTITVNPGSSSYKPVADITGVPTSATAGTDLTLAGTVAPADATNKTIVWSVKDEGTTGATIVDGKLKTTAAGTVVVTATIANGLTATTNYTKDFTITVNPVGTVLYTITFNANGGSVSPATATTDAAGKLSDLPTPTRAGYTFNGWFTAASGGTAVTTTTVFTQDSTIYAQWTQNSGGGGGGSSSPAPSNTIYSTEGSKGTTNVVSQAIKNAIATGGTNVSTSATFNNFDFLAPDGLKTINEIAAKESAGKTVNFTVNFDAGPKEPVNSRITVNPAALAKELTAKNITGKLPLGVWFDQTKDTKVQSVNTLFGKHFSNKIVSVVYDRNSTLAVNAEFCAKLNLAKTFGTDKNLYFYTYDNTTNIYKRIQSPGYRVDRNGYAHITAPFGGSIIITDKPLTSK